MKLRPGIADVTPRHVAAAEAIVGALGGPANIASLEHCVTRLRIALADLRLLDDTRLRNHPAVLGVLRRNTLQIVVAGCYSIFRHTETSVGKLVKELFPMGGHR